LIFVYQSVNDDVPWLGISNSYKTDMDKICQWNAREPQVWCYMVYRTFDVFCFTLILMLLTRQLYCITKQPNTKCFGAMWFCKYVINYL